MFSLSGQSNTWIFLSDFTFQNKLNMKNFTIKNKDNKISHTRENSLRNKVRGWT